MRVRERLCRGANAVFRPADAWIPGGEPQLARVLSVLTREHACEVRREGGLFVIRVPGWESRLLPGYLPQSLEGEGGGWGGAGSALLTLFADHAEIEPGADGRARFRWRYWSPSQIGIHAVITFFFGMEYAFGSAGWELERFAVLTLMANALPFGIFQAMACAWMQRVLGNIDCTSTGGGIRSA